MRIITGKFGGRRLTAVPGTKTRPTTDKVKEAMFSMIGPYFDGGQVLDLFAGTGGLGIEAVSRGCDHAFLVDKQRQAQLVITQNIAVTKAPEQFTLRRGAAESALAEFSANGQRFDLIFLDPPYRFKIIGTLLAKFVALNLVNDQALIVAETDEAIDLTTIPTAYQFIKTHDYGLTHVTVWRYQKETV